MPLIPSSPRFRYVRIFYGKTPNVSSTNYLETTYTGAELGGSGKATFSIDFTLLKLLYGLESGSNLYFVAYGSSASEVSYYSPDSRRYVYPALNPTPSNVVSVVLP